MENWKKYGRPLIGLALSIAVIFGSMNIWILTIISPVFVFLIFKFLGVWKSKERGIYGSIAIIIGIMLFFLAFSYHVSDVPQGSFTKDGFKVTIEPYSTTNMNAQFNITTRYNETTNSSLNYSVMDQTMHRVVERGNVSGIVKDNATFYYIQLNLSKGIYTINLSVNNKTILISAVKETPTALFGRYVRGPGLWLSLLLVSLYVLLIIGIHITRRAYKMGLRKYGKK